MIRIDARFEDIVINAAHAFELFRNECKQFLAKHEKNYDKFTVVQHDTMIGFLTEGAIKNYIESNFPGYSVSTWEDEFNIPLIKSIIHKDDVTEDEINYVENYFYDRWDLKIAKPGIEIYADVKTALTKLEPRGSWNFLYPVVQANKAGKDIMILIYFIVTDLRDLASNTHSMLVGFTTPTIVRTCNIIHAGSRTRFGTVSQIDNYETLLATHYNELATILT